jgi:DNA-binding response OmpR family regulator
MPSRILVVDDDPATQEMVSVILTDAGYETITASTLHAAMDALEEAQPDLLITDIRLRGYNGLHLIATAPKPIPAIVVTGHDDRGLEVEARGMGAEFMVKPFTPLSLLVAVREKLDGMRWPQKPAAPRRWQRQPVPAGLTAQAGDASLQILDVSYGGLRFEIERVPGQFLPLSFPVTVAAKDLQIEIDVVWKARQDGLRWICGAAVSDNRPRWRELVDSLRES